LLHFLLLTVEQALEFWCEQEQEFWCEQEQALEF
jgi:hypothetical protein